MRVKKTLWLSAFFLISSILTAVAWTEPPYQALSRLVDFPWVFCFSYMSQPAFCAELTRHPMFDWITVLVLLINCTELCHVVYSQLTARDATWPGVVMKNFVLGLVINCGNYMVTLMRSV